MTPVFVLDRWEHPGPTREWNAIAPGHLPCHWRGDGPATGEGLPCQTGVVIAHRSYVRGFRACMGRSRAERDGKLRALLLATLASRPRLRLVVVSGDPQIDPPSECGRLYFRRTELGDKDLFFKRCLNEFLLQDGASADFELLEPPQFSDLQDACCAKSASDLSPEQWSKARSQFIRLYRRAQSEQRASIAEATWLFDAAWPPTVHLNDDTTRAEFASTVKLVLATI